MRRLLTLLVLLSLATPTTLATLRAADAPAPTPAAPNGPRVEDARVDDTLDLGDEAPEGTVDALESAAAADAMKALSSAEFLAIARRPPIEDSWAKMTGTLSHYEGLRGTTATIEFRARFTPARILAQIELDGAERYAVSQVFADGMAGTSVINEKPTPAGKRALSSYGLQPNDLTLSFLYWELIEELPGDRVRGQSCRVFRLKHPTQPESCVVAIATKFYFPLRVSWYDAAGKERNRVLEFTNFKRKGDVWIVNEALLKDAGWKTRVRFDKVTVEPVSASQPIPADLFKAD